MMPRLRPFDTISRIAVGLAALVVLCLVTIDALFGLVADPAAREADRRRAVSQVLADQLMVAATRLGEREVQQMLDAFRRRETQALAIVLRPTGAEPVAGSGILQPAGDAGRMHLAVPVQLQGRDWGALELQWQPIPGEFDDYISNPKANDYRSLHTAVIGPEDRGVEVQIRTFEMHEHAEFGVAAHWRYKEGGRGDAQYEEKISWLRQLLDWREEMSGSDKEDLADAFKTELFSDTIYVLTPQGRVLALPHGATPIDFAYALHTDVGHRCRGAKVEGHIVPLSTPLQNGQRVEVLTAKDGGPSVNWLHEGWVKSPRAIAKIRQFIRQQNADAVRETGRQIFERELARHPHVQPNLSALAEKLGYDRLDELYGAIGHGEVSLRALANGIESFAPPSAVELTADDIIRRSKGSHDAGGVLIEGVGNLMTILAKCCKPAPPDSVVGFVTRGRGISIHRSNCITLKRLSADAPERLIAADWGEQKSSVFPIDLEVHAADRPGLLRDISDVFSREKLNVIGVNTLSRNQKAKLRFTVEVRHVRDISRVLAHVMEVRGVQEARRV